MRSAVDVPFVTAWSDKGTGGLMATSLVGSSDAFNRAKVVRGIQSSSNLQCRSLADRARSHDQTPPTSQKLFLPRLWSKVLAVMNRLCKKTGKGLVEARVAATRSLAGLPTGRGVLTKTGSNRAMARAGPFGTCQKPFMR